MTEGVVNIRRSTGAADHRQGIRQRRPVAHPLLAAFGLQARKELLRLVEHGLCTGIIGRAPQSAELHGSADPQTGLQRRDHEAVTREDQLPLQIESVDRQRGVVAALGLERDPVADLARQKMRPGAGSDDHLLCAKRAPLTELDRQAVAGRHDQRHLSRQEGRSCRLRMFPYGFSEEFRVRNSFPARHEGPPHELLRQAGLVFGQFMPCKMLKSDAKALPLVPARKRCLEFPFALVEFEAAVFPQHPTRGRTIHQAHPFGLGQPHQRDLRRQRRFVPRR